MEPKKFAWSYSALSAFETCPFQFAQLRIKKTVKEPPSTHLTWGIKVHDAFEKYMLGELNPVPKWFKPWIPIANVVRDTQGTVTPELEMAITDKFQPTGWWDHDAWCRGKLDVTVDRGDTIHVFDWKTGKRRQNSEQLQLFAALAFIYYPKAQTVRTTFIWLDADAQDTETFTRSDIPDIWGNFLPRVARMQEALTLDQWPKRSSGLCANYCHVPTSMCAHSGKGG